MRSSSGTLVGSKSWSRMSIDKGCRVAGKVWACCRTNFRTPRSLQCFVKRIDQLGEMESSPRIVLIAKGARQMLCRGLPMLWRTVGAIRHRSQIARQRAEMGLQHCGTKGVGNPRVPGIYHGGTCSEVGDHAGCDEQAVPGFLGVPLPVDEYRSPTLGTGCSKGSAFTHRAGDLMVPGRRA